MAEPVLSSARVHNIRLSATLGALRRHPVDWVDTVHVVCDSHEELRAAAREALDGREAVLEVIRQAAGPGPYYAAEQRRDLAEARLRELIGDD